MAKTGCECGVGLWNGYGPGGVNWDIYPMEQFKQIAYANPDMDLYEVGNQVEEIYNNGDWHDLWLCRRCKRIQIWKMDGLYVAYEPVDYEGNVPVEEILNMEEWMAINDYDSEEDYTGVYVLENYPFRPYRYFLSPDKSKVYVYNIDTEEIEFVYQEYVREIEKDVYKDRKGIYRPRYRKQSDGTRLYMGSYYENGEKVHYEKRDRILSGAVYGFVLGDALGVPFEFKERGSFECKGMEGYGTHNQPPGTWSDDTSMMLATCRSLKENNLSVNIEDMREKFCSWLDEGKYTANGDVFDVGHSTLKALRTGVPQRGEFSNGNGSLMRILPLAFVDCSDDEIRQVSGITHDHWISKEACVIYVNVIKRYLSQDCPYSEMKRLEDIIREIPEYPEPFDRLCKLDEMTEDDIKSSGYVVDTLEAALWCILQEDKKDTWKKSYADCLLRAVNLGDDADTVAAVTGGLAGIIYSFDSIPDDWVWKIRNNKLIQECLF